MNRSRCHDPLTSERCCAGAKNLGGLAVWPSELKQLMKKDELPAMWRGQLTRELAATSRHALVLWSTGELA